MKSNFFETLGAFVAFLVLACVIGLILALPVMWLWNWLMPSIFGLGTITWIQAWGINILCNFLFKSSSAKE